MTFGNKEPRSTFKHRSGPLTHESSVRTHIRHPRPFLGPGARRQSRSRVFVCSGSQAGCRVSRAGDVQEMGAMRAGMVGPLTLSYRIGGARERQSPASQS